MTDESSTLVREGREALAHRDWPKAYQTLSRADPAELTPEDFDGLADAALALALWDASDAARARSHAGFAAAGNIDRAAWAALSLATNAFISGDLVVAGGWRETAQRLLSEAPECAAHAYALRSEAYLLLSVGDADAAVEKSHRAVEVARRVGNRDLELVALQFEGEARACRGEVAQGMSLIDEAMIAAVSGQVGPWAFGQIVCQTLTTCQKIGDYRRAAEWLERADRASVVQGIEMSPDCRIHRAGILKLRGSWSRAEAEARIGCEGHPFGPHVGWGWCEIGEIHLQMGDIAGAEEAFNLAHEKGYPPHPGLALLRLAQGNIALATEDIERAFAAIRDDLPARARLLDARVRIAVAANDIAAARASADELAEVAAACGSDAFVASAACADASVLLAEGHAERSAAAFSEGIEALVKLEMPYETAMARTGLAAAHRVVGYRDGALMELHAARSTFGDLGAVLEEERSARLLAELDEIATPPVVAEKTFMFTDIERSTLLLEAFGDRAWDDLLQWHDRTLREAMHTNGGQEVKHEGDGFFVAFDDPGSAIGCAIAIQRVLAQHRREHGFSPQVRIGLHAGNATERDGDYFGMAVNKTARVMSLAAGGEIVATATMVGAGHPASMPREVSLKGVSEPVSIVTLVWD